MRANNFQEFMQDRVQECRAGHVWIPVMGKQPKGCPVCKREKDQRDRHGRNG